MALSDREQKLLEQMEKALYAEDPKFASSLRRSGLTIAPGERRHVIFGLLCLVSGLALVFGSVVSKMVIVGIPGFLLVLTGFVFIARGLQEPVAAATPTPTKVRNRSKNSKLMSRLEERWQQRRDGGV
ncbi:membrane protein [Actinomycetes bacterium]|nr:membrane protein [Actinomycetes bacterium]